MSRTISKQLNNYLRLDGYLLGWERGRIGQGHQASLIDQDGLITAFNWRSPKEPIAGDQLTVVLPEKGEAGKTARPILILNHTSGDRHEEVNDAKLPSTRDIMLWLAVWVLIAFAVTAAICFYATTFEMKVIVLIAAALVNWRMAIATRDIKKSEKSSLRKLEEEAVRAEIALSIWEENPRSRLPRIDIAYDDKGSPVLRQTA